MKVLSACGRAWHNMYVQPETRALGTKPMKEMNGPLKKSDWFNSDTKEHLRTKEEQVKPLLLSATLVTTYMPSYAEAFEAILTLIAGTADDMCLLG